MTAATDTYTVDLEDVGAGQTALVGGKGASLGELSRIDGVTVPAGFCVTTAAFRRGLADGVAGTVPDDVAGAVVAALERFGPDAAYAVRSSATAEDSPSASFAGQHDSFLEVVGADAVVTHVARCWASLSGDRAVAYREQAGIDDAEMAVVVQRMVAPRAAGVLFTADPLTGHRRTATVEAVAGLGEELVSGRVTPDGYTVRDGAVTADAAGAAPVLTDAEVLELVALGRRIEAHFGRPQDIEWCLAEDGFAIVQSRPITTLFPIPGGDGTDADFHVYVSVGHQQMMTDPMRPLGLSLHQRLALPVMHEAAGRLFVDIAARLASPAIRPGLLEMMHTSDPLIGDALQVIVDRGDIPDDAPATDAGPPAAAAAAPAAPPPIPTDPAIVADLVGRTEASLATLERDISRHSGPALLEFILEDVEELRRLLFEPLNHQAIMAGMESTGWLNRRLEEWLGERNVADTLTLSAPGNITSEMGLELLDVADVVRRHPAVVAYLEGVEDDAYLDALDELPGGPESRDAIVAYLDRYGMRCVGEIDITRPRWGERPATLLPTLLGNVRHFEPGAGRRRFDEGARAAAAKEAEVLDRLRALPDGDAKARETKAMIDRVRTFIGYREFPKYGMVCRSAIWKRALLATLAELDLPGDPEDVFFLTLDELADTLRTGTFDAEVVAARRQAFASYDALTPPRVITSDGEVVTGSYRHADLPPGALAGLAVSSGTIEGRARVVLDAEDARLEPGDILVTAFTDPSWSPLFVAAAGLVTEVGGLMTHGAVVAREYGLPAVVGVEGATTRIRDGQRIRVHGNAGHVELLE